MDGFLGIDVGGTLIKAVVTARDGNILLKEAVERPEKRWIDSVQRLADSIGPELPTGICAPGLAAKDRRSIAFMPGRLDGLEGLAWGDLLGRGTFVPVTNDAHASLLGEAWVGAARGLRDIVMITLGTGVGGAIMADGRLLRGHIGRAGHIGHICLDTAGLPSIVGTPGALEDMIGNHNVKARTGCNTTHELAAAYRNGDPTASCHWLSSIRALACGLASIVNVVDPEAIVIGGGIAKAGEALFQPLAAELDRIEWRPAGHAVRILPAALGEWAGAVGAAREAMLAPESV